MPENTTPSFIAEAEGRRETIASQIAHLERNAEELKETLERNKEHRAHLRALDAEYVEAIEAFRAATWAP